MRRKVISIAVFVLCFGALLYVLRGPNVSNALKKIILPELELVTGKKVIAQKIYINILPLFIEMKGVKLFDDEGERILEVERVKGYIGLSGLLKKELTVKRLVFKTAAVHAERAQLEEIIDHVKTYLEEERTPAVKVVIKSVEISRSVVALRDRDALLTLGALDALVIAAEAPRCRISSRELVFRKEGIPEVAGALEAHLTVNGTALELTSLKLAVDRSGITTSGVLDTGKTSGAFQAEIDLVVDSVKKLFGLKSSGAGDLSAKGRVTLDGRKQDINAVAVDLKIKGEFYLETLMELLKVTEPLRGSVRLDGEVKGPLGDLKGKGHAELVKGNLFTVPVDALTCSITYENGEMHFTDGKARLYGGSAAAEAMIRLPVVTEYRVQVSVREVSSRGLFTLIGWTPPIPEGRVSGEMYTAGDTFSPRGHFVYSSASKGGDVLDRVREIRGVYAMSNDSVRFDTLTVATASSSVAATGSVDLKAGTLQFRGSGTTGEVSDLSAPYFTALSGPATFTASLSGPSADPVLDLQFSGRNLTLATGRLGLPELLHTLSFPFEAVEGAATYRKNLLTLKQVQARSARGSLSASGRVAFPHAQELFDLKRPVYDLTLKAKDAPLSEYRRAFQGAPPLGGTVDLEGSLQGSPDDLRFSGGFTARNASFGGDYSLESAAGGIAYRAKEFLFDEVRLKKGDSSLTVTGRVSTDNHFSFTARGERVALVDALPLPVRKTIESGYKRLPEEDFFNALTLTRIKGKGEGAFAHPQLELSADIHGGMYRGHLLGSGELKARLEGKRVTAAAQLLDRKLNISGAVTLAGEMPWSARLDLQPARYDFIIANFLKDVPEDLLLTLKGTVEARGDRRRADAAIEIAKAHLYAYGTGFTNSRPISATMQNKLLTITTFSMRSEVSEFKAGGTMTFGKSYDLLIEGSSSLAPLKALSKSIDTLRGNASFVLSLSGDWNRPKVNGALDITNGTLGLKNISYRLSSLNAYAYVDEDRIVLERASGKLAGGEVSFFGTAYLQRFALKRFFLESRLKGITAAPSKDFWVNLDGALHYRGDLSSQTILGDIAIKRAKYSERVEWKSWLLRVRQKERTKTEATRLDATNLNLRISGSAISIDNNVSRASMKADLLVRGTIGQPVLLGKIEAREGIVFFRNNEFKILKASIDFSNPNQVHPYFDIVSETNTKGYNIRLSLDGYIEQFNLSLASDPPLDETDIFSLLTVGQIGKNLKGLEGGIGASEATSFLTGKIQDVIEERLKTVTGFDRVQIDPSISKTTGTVSPRVTIAKRLLGDRLYVTYSTSVSTGEEQVWKLEYLLGKNTSLLGVRDERGSLGGDVKFRFEFK